MKICYVSQVDISLPTGPGVNEREFVWTLQEKCKEKKDSAHVVIPRPSRELDFTLPHVSYLPKGDSNRKGLAYVLENLRLNLQAVRVMQRENLFSKTDLFAVRLGLSNFLIPFWVWRLHKRYALKTFEAFLDVEGTEAPLDRKMFYACLQPLLRLVLKRAAAIDVCTPQLMAAYRSAHGLRNIILVENAVNLHRFHPMDKDRCKTTCRLEQFKQIVGYVGGYPSQRGAAQLVKIAPELAKKYPNCGILVIGDDSDLTRIKQEARRSSAAGRVVFTGVVDYAQLPIYVNCLDVGVSLDSSKRVNVVGNSSQKVRQYLACGVPVVFPENTNKDILNAGLGRAIDPEDGNSLAMAVCEYFDQSSEETLRFRKRAFLYSQERLSVEVAYEKRYDAWVTALSDLGSSRGGRPVQSAGVG